LASRFASGRPDPKDKCFEDNNTAKNVSRDGIYFVTTVSGYYEGIGSSCSLRTTSTITAGSRRWYASTRCPMPNGYRRAFASDWRTS
jgi:hypothetical protein